MPARSPLRIAVLADLSESKQRDVVRGILRAAQARRPRAQVAAWPAATASVADARAWGAQAVLVQANSPELERAVRRLRVPAVSISSVQRRLPTVRVDDDAVGRAAAEHLAARGCRRFAVIAHPSDFGVRRQRAFAARLAALGSPAPAVIAPAALAHAARSWAHDGTPVGVLALTTADGRRVARVCAGTCPVPGIARLLVAGDDELFCACADPPLSAVPLAGEACGEAAVALLRRLVAGSPPLRAPVLVAPGRVIARRSTDADGGADPRVAAAVAWLGDRLDRPIGVADIASAVGVSRRTLETAFRRALGLGVARVLRERRLDRATQLLLDTGLPLRSVAAAVGYATAEHLGTLLRRHRGATPGRMRQRRRAG